MSWIGVDLDGTLAEYDGWRGPEHIGKPVPAMMRRVRRWLAEGREVRILTARVATPSQWLPIKLWLSEHDLDGIAVVCAKDEQMAELWDDRAVAVEKNTGRQLSDNSLFESAPPPRGDGVEL